MRIGLFGGAFNPPHLAHLIVAESARVHAGLDGVLWIPTGKPPHKPEAPLIPAADRLEMVSRAIKGNPYFEVSDVEVSRRGPSYMVETLAILKDRRPNDHFDLIIGGDSLFAFATWFRYKEIVRQTRLLVFDRHDFDYSELDAEIIAAVTLIPEAPRIEISSSDIRARIAAGRSIRYLVPESVETYIRRRNLYAA